MRSVFQIPPNHRFAVVEICRNLGGESYERIYCYNTKKPVPFENEEEARFHGKWISSAEYNDIIGYRVIPYAEALEAE